MGILSLSSLSLCVALFVSADERDSAVTRTELRQLQTEVQRLDDSLAAVDQSDPQASDYERRADQIRQDLTRLKDQMLWGSDDHESSGVSRAELDAVRDATVDLRNDIDRSMETRQTAARD